MENSHRGFPFGEEHTYHFASDETNSICARTIMGTSSFRARHLSQYSSFSRLSNSLSRFFTTTSISALEKSRA